MMTASQPD